MNSKIEFPRSFETLKSLLVSKCNAVQKMTKKALEGIRRLQPSDQSESSASREGSVLDCLLREIDEDEKQKRHEETEFIRVPRYGSVIF
uniref:Uncharacterized protein n=1 Tax=Ditylenchus dipsaci TaxID=166011 RepID=A0A915DNR7_9BILA